MKVFKLQGDAVLPTIKHIGDAGMDFYAYNNWVIKPHLTEVVSTGIGVIIPKSYVGLLKPKGGSHWMLGAGVVDSNYRGEILFKVVNTSDRPISIMHGQPVGQMIVLKNLVPTGIEEIDKSTVADTNRGATGGIVDQRITKWD